MVEHTTSLVFTAKGKNSHCFVKWRPCSEVSAVKAIQLSFQGCCDLPIIASVYNPQICHLKQDKFLAKRSSSEKTIIISPPHLFHLNCTCYGGKPSYCFYVQLLCTSESCSLFKAFLKEKKWLHNFLTTKEGISKFQESEH